MMPNNTGIQIIGIEGIPEIHHGDELAQIIIQAIDNQQLVIQDKDILVVAQKIVSKAEGRIIDINSIIPSQLAITLSENHRRDPRHTELILQESKRIVRMDRGVIISETYHGFKCANAGIDSSNIAGDFNVALLPVDPDVSARKIRNSIKRDKKVEVGIIISDTFGRPWRTAAVNIAIGVSGFNPLTSYVGEIDKYGNQMYTSVINTADELAAAAELVTGKTSQIPVSLIRGFQFESMENAANSMLNRDPDKDLFR
jgi:coenzyme F420-0:L-glutamate ligase/coenzyme F420-1:gamma-L-glutamate ligase